MTGVSPKRPVGRPPRVDRDAIAEAVLELGLENASMKAVAENLDISVPGLYHHVKNRKELLLLAAERSLARFQPPVDNGQHWSVWLRQWGHYSRTALIEDPEVFQQYLSGAMSWDQMLDVLESVIQVLGRQGFTPAEAMTAWDTVGNCALGSVVTEIRFRAATAAGRGPVAEFLRVLAERPEDELGGVRALLSAGDIDADERFDAELTTVLAGIAVERGESPTVVVPGKKYRR